MSLTLQKNAKYCHCWAYKYYIKTTSTNTQLNYPSYEKTNPVIILASLIIHKLSSMRWKSKHARFR